MTKTCANCRIEKESGDFSPSKIQKDKLFPYCRVCKNAKHKQHRYRLRSVALKAYGEKCAICGEVYKEFLAIDHVKGGGCKERMAGGGAGWNFSRVLKNRGYPAGYRLLCHNCNKRCIPVKETKSPVQRWWKKLRTEVLTHYGNGLLKCCCCGENDLVVLSLDHIAGGGTAERKRLGGSTCYLYIKLRKEGFPAGYRTLCLNCNLARGFYGSCPHE